MKLLAVQPGASYSTADVYTGLTNALRRAGHEVGPYLLDHRIDAAGGWLTAMWKAAGKPADRRPTPADIQYRAGVDILERALRHQPDWVLVISAMYFHPDLFVLLRRAGQRVAVVLTESPYDADREERILPFVDVAFTNERTMLARYRRYNPWVSYLPHAYDPQRHPYGPQPGDEDVRAHDVVFVGTMFQERLDLLSAVDWSGIDLGLYGSFELLGSRHHLRRFIRGGITDNAKAAALYRRAKVGLNLHRTSMGFGRDAPRIEGAYSLNPRAYELAAAGCFQISDDRPEGREVFGGALVTFPSMDGRVLGERLRHFLAWEPARNWHAKMARKRVRPHTFDARAAQIIETLSAYAGREPVVDEAGEGIDQHAYLPSLARGG